MRPLGRVAVAVVVVAASGCTRHDAGAEPHPTATTAPTPTTTQRRPEVEASKSPATPPTCTFAAKVTAVSAASKYATTVVVQPHVVAWVRQDDADKTVLLQRLDDTGKPVSAPVDLGLTELNRTGFATIADRWVAVGSSGDHLALRVIARDGRVETRFQGEAMDPATIPAVVPLGGGALFAWAARGEVRAARLALPSGVAEAPFVVGRGDPWDVRMTADGPGAVRVAWLDGSTFTPWVVRVPATGPVETPRVVSTQGTPLAFVATAAGPRMVFFRTAGRNGKTVFLEGSAQDLIVDRTEDLAYDMVSVPVHGRSALVAITRSSIKLSWLDDAEALMSPSTLVPGTESTDEQAIAGDGDRVWVALQEGHIPKIDVTITIGTCR